ncbi:MAG TPA: head GIN domain-containing protein [Allosphingosinicella sp.]|jgi:hypothetical protein
MKIMHFLALLGAFAATPAAAAERRFSVSDFDRVQIDGPFEVSLATGGSSNAVAVGDQRALERVDIDVQGRTLRIRASRSAWGGYPGNRAGSVRIMLSTRDLRAATLIGAGSLAVDRARGLRVELSVSGSGSLTMGSVETDNLVLGLVGSGTMTVGGTAKQLRATVDGAGSFDGSQLIADDLQLVAGTSGQVVVGARRIAKVTAHGRGEVDILGTPACTLRGPAASQVRCGR